MAENTEELDSEETPQTRAGTPRNFSIGDIRDGSNIFTFVMEQLHTMAEGMNELHQRLSALEQLQGKYGNVVADSVDAQSVKVGGVDVMPQGGDYAPKNHASAQPTYGQATTSNYGHAKLSNDTLNANSTGTAGVACSTGHKHSQYIEKSATSGLVKNDGTIDTSSYIKGATATAGSHIGDVGTPNVSVNINAQQQAVFTFNYLKGATGATGPAGPQGPVGPQGPSGFADYEWVTSFPTTYVTGKVYLL